ncbi:MOSC domain-containing protein [Oleiharenicola lentus]|uniref:MOSC domain-containing protein n=1 Tax=Oleiharenicola lentus TaxID=2508720 RepID=UPI003F676E54
MFRVTGLFIYPVKALRGFSVPTAEVDPLGFVGDRRFLVVDQTGKFLTQRSHPHMALIATRLTTENLILSTQGFPEIAVARASDPSAPIRSVTVWKNEGLLAEDCGDAVAYWLSDFLKLSVRLVRAGEKFHRPVKPSEAKPGDIVTFADAHPFLLISQASLDDLNDRLLEKGSEALPMNRFRPNIVIEGCTPFEEDNWPHVRIGDLIFRNSGPCARCIVTTTDQLTAERGKEPLKTLATYRRDPKDPSDVNFGANLIHETKRGTVHVCDVATPL